MSEHDPHEHQSFIKTPKQLLAVVILAFVVPIGIISILASLVTSSVDPSEQTQASKDLIAKRLKPVGQVVVAAGGSAAPAQAAAAAAAPTQVAAAAPASKDGGAANGEAVFKSACFACHGTGAAGAPKPGDKAAWQARLAQGMEAVHQNAIKGKGAMPPKGGNMALSDAEVRAAVDFMVQQSK